MKMSKALWLAPLLGILAMPVLADDNDGHKRHGHRDDRQHARIDQGVRKGDLTRHEARQLHQEQRRVAKTERHYRRDGQVDRHERRDLKQRRDQASRHIHQLKHNDRGRDQRYRDRGHHHGWHQHAPHHKQHQHRWTDHDRYRRDHAKRGRHYDDGNWWVMFGLRDRL